MKKFEQPKDIDQAFRSFAETQRKEESARDDFSISKDHASKQKSKQLAQPQFDPNAPNPEE